MSVKNAIWFKPATIESIQLRQKDTIVENLGIEFLELGNDYLTARMPVDQRTHQPMGLLHGGASVVLAESLASVGCRYTLDESKYNCVGLEVNANHIRSVSEGYVTGMAKPVHLGRSTQIWNIEIKNDSEKLVCIARMTMAVLKLDSGW